jgi:LysM repeat protein
VLTHHKYTYDPARSGVCRAIAAAGFLLLIATVGHAGIAAAVSEQAIGAAAERDAPSAPPPAETSGPATVPQNLEVSTAPTVPPTVRPLQPHATFPYTIRSGDSLGSIANQFGISLGELSRVNRIDEETELMVGRLLRIPNPAVAHERDLTAQIDQLQRDKQDATDRAMQAETRLTAARASLQTLTVEQRELSHDARSLGWWRGSTYVLAGIAFLLFGAVLLTLIDWWMLRNRFRAVAEMNESLRRLDHKYKTALAKGELRLQELYGRRRRGLHEGQDRPKLAEEAEMEALTRELKTVLEHHLERLGPAGAGAQRAQWRERIARIGAPAEPRPVRR